MQTKSPFAQLIDRISLFLVVFIITNTIVSKISKRFIFSLILTLAISFTIFIHLIKRINKKNHSKNLSKKEEEHKKDVLNALKYGNPVKIKSFFIKLLSKKYIILNHSPNLEIKSTPSPTTILYNFTANEISIDYIKNAVFENKGKKIIILGNNFSNEAQILSNSLNIKTFDANLTYLLLKEHNIFPKLTKTQEPTPKFKEKIKAIFQKQNAFKFFRYSLLLFVFSLILPFSAYYKIIAIILFIFGIISTFKRGEKSTEKSISLI